MNEIRSRARLHHARRFRSAAANEDVRKALRLDRPDRPNKLFFARPPPWRQWHTHAHRLSLALRNSSHFPCCGPNNKPRPRLPSLDAMFRGVAHRPPRTRLVEARAHAEYSLGYASSSEHDTLPEVDAGQAFHRRIQWPPLLKLICPLWGGRFDHSLRVGSKGNAYRG